MASTLNISGFELQLNLESQLSKNGKLIRLSGIEKLENDKFINGILKNHWIYIFRYVGTDLFVKFEFDYNDKFVKICN